MVLFHRLSSLIYSSVILASDEAPQNENVMKRIPSIIRLIMLTTIQIVIFVGLYEIGFSLDIWLTQGSSRLGIGYGLTLRTGLKIFSILAFINAAIGIFRQENKDKIISAIISLFFFGWWFTGIASTWPYKFTLILFSGATGLMMPLLIGKYERREKAIL